MFLLLVPYFYMQLAEGIIPVRGVNHLGIDTKTGDLFKKVWEKYVRVMGLPSYLITGASSFYGKGMWHNTYCIGSDRNGAKIEVRLN